MSPSKHDHHSRHFDPDFFTTPSLPQFLPLPLPSRTRTSSPSLLLKYNVYDELRAQTTATSTTPALKRSKSTSTSTTLPPFTSTSPLLPPPAITIDASDDTKPSPRSKSKDEDENTRARARRAQLLSDSEISVLDLGPSFCREVSVGDSAGVVHESKADVRLREDEDSELQFHVGYDGNEEDVTKEAFRLGSFSAGSVPSSVGGEDGQGDIDGAGKNSASLDAGVGTAKKRRFDEFDTDDHGNDFRYFGQGHEGDSIDVGAGAGDHQFTFSRTRRDGMDVALGHGQRRGHGLGARNRKVTITSPLLLPLKTTRRTRRGISWSRMRFGF